MISIILYNDLKFPPLQEVSTLSEFISLMFWKIILLTGTSIGFLIWMTMSIKMMEMINQKDKRVDIGLLVIVIIRIIMMYQDEVA